MEAHTPERLVYLARFRLAGHVPDFAGLRVVGDRVEDIAHWAVTCSRCLVICCTGCQDPSDPQPDNPCKGAL